ncbi:MAG TPA: Gfo/Idh/MocA family oxidoreductase [Candidatus Brocadiia bacterium]|nr:Gfo/Idh/MocA family oxidoreductase [Candidatus Brocadiia bacterium]
MAKDAQVGIIGCGEGTHGKVWAELLSGKGGKKFGMKVAKVWDGDRETAETLAIKTGAEAVEKFEDAGEGVDGVMITELFPDRYLELARPFLRNGGRIFFNRPFAADVNDAREILRLARKNGAKVYSASALYHTEAGAKAIAQLDSIRPVKLFTMTGPTDHLYFYLPHAIAALVNVLGTGIARIQALSLTWKPNARHLSATPVMVYVKYAPDAKIGDARGIIQMTGPGTKWYGFRLKLFGAEKESDEIRFEVSYDKLLENMAMFFKTGLEPVPHEVILEQTVVFYAALQSADERGKAVHTDEMMRSDADALGL